MVFQLMPSLLALSMALVAVGGFAMLTYAPSAHARLQKRFNNDTHAAFQLSGGLGVASAIIGAIVVILIVAALIGPFISALGDTNNALNTGTTNDTVGDTILGVMPIIVAVGGVFGIVGLILAAMKFRSS